MVEPAKNSIWNYLIPLWQLEQVSSTFGRRGVEVSLTSHCYPLLELKLKYPHETGACLFFFWYNL